MTEPVWYLFCVAEGQQAPDLAPPLTAVTWEDLHAVLRPVDPAEFAGLEPGPDGAIPGALAELLLQHDAVVRAVFAAHPVLPFRFGTALPDRQATRAFLQDRYGLLKTQLDRVRGHEEWGVRWHPVPQTRTAVPEAKGGRSYLQQRSRQLQEGREAERRFRAQIRQVHADLAQLATESQAAEQELACTYLVRHENAAAFRERAEGTGAHVTGPWPPYSFCSPLQEEPVRA